MRTKLFGVGIAILLTCGLIIAPTGFDLVFGAETLKFGTSLRTSPHHALPLLAATEKGFWKREGLDAEWVPFRSGRSFYRAMAAKALKIGFSGAISAIRSSSRGIPVIIVADLKLKKHDFYVYVRTDSAIKKPLDLKGAKIGIARFGGVVHAYGRVVVKSLGIEKEMKLVAGGGVLQELAALRSGTLDGKVSDFFTMAPLVGEGVVRELLSINDFLPRRWIDVVIVSRTDFLKTNKADVKKMVRGVLKARDFVTENREWALEKIRTYSGYKGEVAKAVNNAVNYGKGGQIDSKALENVRNFLIEYGVLKEEETVPLDKLYTKEITG
ncbi:MAG: ABC transporter substrate-binding protein [Thermodesulfobacteriota bacterium]